MLHTKHQSSRPSTFKKEFRNLSSLFLCSNLWPHRRTSPDPRGIIWTDLLEVHKEMLKTKYQGSRHSSFRVEELWNFHSLFLCSTFMNKLGSRRCHIPNIKSLHHPVSEKKNFENGLLCSNLWPPGWGHFDPGGITWTDLVRGPQGDAIYQISKV